MAQTSPAVDLLTLLDAYDTDEECRDYLEDLRWPTGPICPRCHGKVISRIKARKVFECDGCRYQFSVKAGTLFHDSHLPLPKWFLAIFLMCESRKGMSALQLKRMLKVSYKTAWYLCHRIRAAMIELNPRPLTGTVEELHAFIRETVDDQVANIYTDQHRGYLGIADANTRHETVNHSINEWVRGDVHTQTVESAFSLFKRAVVGSFHCVSEKHLDRYLDEFEFRFNNRKNPYLFRDVLLKLMDSKAMPYEQLTA